MTDQTLDDQVRPIVAAMRAAMRRDDPYYSDGAFLEDMSGYVRDLENLLPDPPLPTLADMTPEERRECRRMQCDVEGRSMRYVIANPHENDCEVILLDSDGGIDWVFLEYVTPRPDLPRMEWPGAEKPDSAPALPEGWRLADHPVYGRVMVTSPAPDRDGYLWGFRPDDTREGADRTRYKPDKLTYLPQ